MKYYLGEGPKLQKDQCKEYKTLKGALSAAEGKNLIVWDEAGNCIDAQQDEHSLEKKADNTEERDGEAQKVSNDPAERNEPKVIFPETRMIATVICDGSLNPRRSPSWEDEDVCGRAVKGQSYYVKGIHTVEGKKMVETKDGLFLSGQAEHVQLKNAV